MAFFWFTVALALYLLGVNDRVMRPTTQNKWAWPVQSVKDAWVQVQNRIARLFS